MNTPHSPQSLWSFALKFYAKPQTAEACLYLQDQHGANVCILIALCWLDERSIYLSTQGLIDLIAYTQKWTQEIIEPLRTLRRLLKQPFEHYAWDEQQEELRNSIKQAELLSEKKLLMEIESWTKKNSSINGFICESNVKNYFINLGMDKNVTKLVYEKIISE